MIISVQLLAAPAQVVTDLLQHDIFPKAPARMNPEAVLIQSVHLLLVLVETNVLLFESLQPQSLSVTVQREHFILRYHLQMTGTCCPRWLSELLMQLHRMGRFTYSSGFKMTMVAFTCKTTSLIL